MLLLLRVCVKPVPWVGGADVFSVLLNHLVNEQLLLRNIFAIAERFCLFLFTRQDKFGLRLHENGFEMILLFF